MESDDLSQVEGTMHHILKPRFRPKRKDHIRALQEVLN